MAAEPAGGQVGRGRTLRLAHRGDHRAAPENSLEAFRAALAVPGCDGLEFDVRGSRDGVPVVIHDETLERVQGRPWRVDRLTAAELEPLGVPALEAVLRNVPHRCFLDVELKADLGRSVVEVLSAARGPQLGAAVVSSFEAAALRSIRHLAPTWPTWLNADDLGPATLDLATELGCAGVSAEWHALDEGALAGAAGRGLAVAAWTVTDPAVRDRLAGLGLAAVCVEGSALAEP
ncbi:MAG TPA: glycerophosphodiester phosphodiesterase [Candidatus Limnocylindrales bacterium]